MQVQFHAHTHTHKRANAGMTLAASSDSQEREKEQTKNSRVLVGGEQKNTYYVSVFNEFFNDGNHSHAHTHTYRVKACMHSSAIHSHHQICAAVFVRLSCSEYVYLPQQTATCLHTYIQTYSIIVQIRCNFR